MKPRIPLAYAGFLIVALVAVVGFAAFSPSAGDSESTATTASASTVADQSASARVASAILALRVSAVDSQTATTTAQNDTEGTTVPEAATITTASSTSTTESSTTSSSTTEPTTTTEETPTTTTDSTPPDLKVTSPDDGDTLDERVVTFVGTTEPGATVSSGPYDATVDDDGSWSVQLVLSPGPNGAVFTARDSAGNETSIRIVVTYEPPVTTTTTTQPQTTTTTTATTTTEPKWSPLWPADAGGRRDVEAWRSLVEKYWPAELVDCALNLIDLESHGDPRAYNSYTGAEGLFQHLSKYWKSRAAAAGFRDSDGLYASPYNAEANIAAAWVIASGADPWHSPWSVDPYYGACEE